MGNFKLNTEEIQSLRNQNNRNMGESNQLIIGVDNSIDDFVNNSNSKLQGPVWNLLLKNLDNYDYCLELSSKLNVEIEETFDNVLKTMQDFLYPDSTIDTSKLDDYLLAKEVATYKLNNTIFKSEDGSEKLKNEISEIQKKIDKIDEFNSSIKPQVLNELDLVHTKVIRLNQSVNWFSDPNLNHEIINRYINGNDEDALFYFDENGRPYGVYYYSSNIFIDYNKGQYYRYDPETNTYSPISIFDDNNVFSTQYGASQMAFSDNFEELIQDPLIWEELQTYYPVESFDSNDSAMEFYERYFNLITNTGCGYAAGTNIIFKEYEGRETEFEETFGFPMYTVDNKGNLDFNYELMQLKYFNYSNANKGYTIEQMERGHEVINNNIQDFFDTSAVSTSCELYNLDDFLETFDIESDATVDSCNRFPFFSNDNNLNDKASSSSSEHDYLVYGGDGWDLYIPDDDIYLNGGELYSENGGSHYMMITGYTEDGKPIVSTWGNKFILDIKGNDTEILDMYRYYYVDFNN